MHNKWLKFILLYYIIKLLDVEILKILIFVNNLSDDMKDWFLSYQKMTFEMRNVYHNMLRVYVKEGERNGYRFWASRCAYNLTFMSMRA